MEEGKVWVRRHGAARIRHGHLWVYRSDVARESGVGPGAIVSVFEEPGRSKSTKEIFLGKAFYSSASQISLRLLTRAAAPIDREFLYGRILAASRLRDRLGVDPVLSRRLFAEGDLLPGLIVDRYGDYLVVQSLIQATDRLLETLVAILQEIYRPRSILIRNESKVREIEALPLQQTWIGAAATSVVVQEDGVQMEIPLTEGQKTGAFLDQRENHRAARRYAHGKALDGFTYTGGFALQLAGVCESVEAVDISADAIGRAQANAARNRIGNVRCIEANVFDFLRQRYSENARYDTIVLDPPAFAKNRESVERALRGYKEINHRAMRLLRDGGILVTCSCSHHISEGAFAEMLAEAANDAGCWTRVLARQSQAPDHPILLTVPETFYLKCFVLQIIN